MSKIKQRSAQETPNLVIRPFRESDIDFVISRQLALYMREYGFTSDIWKAYLTNGVHDLVERFDDKKDCMYILENGGVLAGCVAIAHVDAATAQLRFFFLEPEIRGHGAGHDLLDRAVDFCQEKKYERVFLWTFSMLMAARHLYERKGFRMTETHINDDWGETVLEERWDLEL
jgi:N-acetylglutamate synthase-like GNAT family acetyltransferase